MSALRVAVALAVTTPVLSTVIGGSEPTRCTSCWQLTHCTALNGLSLPDPIVGYTRYAQNATSQLDKQGVCEDIDRAVTLLTVFGGKYQYKDTSACRELVGTLNVHSAKVLKSNTLAYIYDNACLNAPMPPCRSLCVQVADQCVFMHSYKLFLTQVCSAIPCTDKPTGTCVPGQNELNPGFNRCTVHDDYLTLPLSKGPSWLHTFPMQALRATVVVVAALSNRMAQIGTIDRSMGFATTAVTPAELGREYDGFVGRCVEALGMVMRKGTSTQGLVKATRPIGYGKDN
ncbi:hypothetical protein AaE_015519 [Aphanomyces astaci]|uniref:FZ domain-containing protein n=1 Tax=Aphanomyces astaci TaxID=112090 RepID=A0A6A4Z1W8_APHAT|nr:hypothetical protein AaE_015519 [Aphanomyces astaci]